MQASISWKRDVSYGQVNNPKSEVWSSEAFSVVNAHDTFCPHVLSILCAISTKQSIITADQGPVQISFTPEQKAATNTSLLVVHETTIEQPHNMSDQHPSQPSNSPEEKQVRDTPLITDYEAPWSISNDPNARVHKWCKRMMDAFAEEDYETAQYLAHLLILMGDVLFRVYPHLVSSHLLFSSTRTPIAPMHKVPSTMERSSKSYR